MRVTRRSQICEKLCLRVDQDVARDAAYYDAADDYAGRQLCGVRRYRNQHRRASSIELILHVQKLRRDIRATRYPAFSRSCGVGG